MEGGDKLAWAQGHGPYMMHDNPISGSCISYAKLPLDSCVPHFPIVRLWLAYRAVVRWKRHSAQRLCTFIEPMMIHALLASVGDYAVLFSKRRAASRQQEIYCVVERLFGFLSYFQTLKQESIFDIFTRLSIDIDHILFRYEVDFAFS